MSNELITIREKAGLKIIDVNDDLGSFMSASLRHTLDEIVSQNTPKVLVNLSQVKHICSMAIGALIGTLRKLQRQGGDLKIFGLAANIKRTFELVGATDMIVIYDSESEALNDL
jgi:anti-sigma B factor antagonist